MANGRRGTVRFAPYFKLEWFDSRSLVWRPIQQTYPTRDDAIRHAAAAPPGAARLRVYEITAPGAAGRRVVQEITRT